MPQDRNIAVPSTLRDASFLPKSRRATNLEFFQELYRPRSADILLLHETLAATAFSPPLPNMPHRQTAQSQQADTSSAPAPGIPPSPRPGKHGPPPPTSPEPTARTRQPQTCPQRPRSKFCGKLCHSLCRERTHKCPDQPSSTSSMRQDAPDFRSRLKTGGIDELEKPGRSNVSVI